MKLIYNVNDKPKFGQMLVFAFQQLLAIMAATIAVPAIVGNGMTASAALFGAGVGTLVYQLLTKFKSPVFLGSSFAFIGSMTAAFAGAVSMAAGYMGLILGAIFAGLVYVVIATLHGHNNQLSFKIVTAGFVVAFLIINDVVEPAYKGELKTLDRDKKNNYLKYVIFDVAGFMALLYFALYAGEIRHVFHYLGLAIFVLLIKPKKESYNEFTKENA